jgi:predicted RNase H-like HicB family nuclease
MNNAQTAPERLIDEMAIALMELLRIEDEAHCILALMEHGFRAAEITAHFDEALALARMARADGWHVFVEPLSEADGGGFLARVPDLPGCMSDGRTPEEATESARRAIVEWIEEATRLGRPIPEVRRHG